MPFASAISEHPVTSEATGEVAGAILERLGPCPDLVMAFVTPPHAGALEDIASTIQSVLQPLALVGCAAESVIGVGREVEQSPSITLFAGRFGPLLPLALDAGTDADGDLDISGWPTSVSFEPSALLLLADPFTFPTEDFLEWVHARYPDLPVVGGMASAARGPGGNRLVLHGAPPDVPVRTKGAVGVLLGPGVAITTIVSQGCRPFGQPLTVTQARRRVIVELAGQSPIDRLLTEASSGLNEREVALLESGGLHLGRVIDEHKPTFERGDFLVRNVVGVDRATGAIAVNDTVNIGTTVQFHLRDADAADEELRFLLAGQEADAALLFTCNGRGTRLFDQPHHDAGVLEEAVGPIPTAGFFAAGELGPVGGQNFLHGFTASLALFKDR